jgi:succinoglycan biosynthesis protein ExoO
MPSFNSAASLRVAVSSVLNQSLARVEIIIVDDASSDATAAVVDEMAKVDGRVRYLRQARNGGPSAARNVALDLARGDWIAPVDADDEIDVSRLRTLYEAGEALSADLIADGVLFIGNPGSGASMELSRSAATDHVGGRLSVEMLIESDIPLNGRCSLGYLKPLMRLDFLRRFDLQYDEDLWFAEDFNLYARALLCGARFYQHPASYYIYNQTPSSISRSADTLPELARQALLGNQKLCELDERLQRPGLRALLATHRLRWTMILWFNRLKIAMRTGEAREALHLLLNCPGGSPNMAAFAKDRIRLIRERACMGPAPPVQRVSQSSYRSIEYR